MTPDFDLLATLESLRASAAHPLAPLIVIPVFVVGGLVIAPLTVPGFVSAAVLAFAHTLGEFGVVLMVGGNIPGETRTVSIAIYDHVESLRYPAAHQLSLILLVSAFAILLAMFLFNNRRARA